VSEHTAAHWIDRVRNAEKAGDYLRAADYAETTLLDPEIHLAAEQESLLQELLVRAVARSGASERALKLYEDFELDREAGEDALALKGRILKDQALAAHSAGRVEKLCAAATVYRNVFERTGGSFPAINAATLFRLAGDKAKAEALAEETLAACTREHQAAEAKKAGSGSSYWHHATLAEAQLVLGNADAVAEQLRLAGGIAEARDFVSRASTRKQLSLLCNELGFEVSILDGIKLPDMLFFAGHFIAAPGQPGRFPADQEDRVRAEIERYLDAHEIGFAFGSLAAGSDILVAEACLKRDIDLHIVLPFRKDDFIAVSVEPSGAGWNERFERCMVQVEERAARDRGKIDYATDGAYLEDDSLFTYCAQYAMGLAMVQGRYLSSQVRMLCVYDGESGPGVGTYENIELWRTFDLPLDIISVKRSGEVAEKHDAKDRRGHPPREPRAIMFGDVKGFSGLEEERLPFFHSEYMAQLSVTLEEFGGKVLYVNSWGDAIYAIFDSAVSGARCGLELQRVTKRIDFLGSRIGRKLELRLGMHYGPVFRGRDFICQEETFFGSHVTRAARIEPITPPGEVFVTEQMAAALALTPEAHIECDYMGKVQSAKKYGSMRMYVLREAA
jgi:class 3 adenylate cyclase